MAPRSRKCSRTTSASGATAAAVLNLLLGIRRSAAAQGYQLEKISIDVVEVNYEPAMIARVDGRVDSVYVFSIEGDVITGIRVVRNPDKLVYLARQLNTQPFGPASRVH
jgi:RNA polymerase sigma-70 factor (ECF subfamily)